MVNMLIFELDNGFNSLITRRIDLSIVFFLRF